MAPSSRPVYAQEQLDQYFARINFNEPVIAKEDAGRQAGLAYLTALQRQQVGHVPFENLSLHYSPSRHVTTDPRALYEKIVVRRRGGYCMENNGFFGTVLRTLGFQLYSAGGRVTDRVPSEEGYPHTGWYDR
jgi:arylamine N-acetyltransferase